MKSQLLSPYAGLWLVAILVLGGLGGCELHDYWQMPDTLRVNAGEEILVDSFPQPLAQEMMVRYQVDYSLQSTSSEVTEVVVSAKTYVHESARAKGQKVWRLEPMEEVHGNFTHYDLELGNSLNVSLTCCEESACLPREVLCPDESTLPSGGALTSLTDQMGKQCFEHCQRAEVCLAECPAKSVCEKICEGVADVDKCKRERCQINQGLSSCRQLCDADEECLEKCLVEPECIQGCYQRDTACFGNCLSSWMRCTEHRYATDYHLNKSEALVIPCALCEGTGLCYLNWNRAENLYLDKEDGTSLECAARCDSYPAACMKECLELFDSADAQLSCATACIEQHLYWCHNFVVPDDFLDSKHEQPCCYGRSCDNTLEVVVKTQDVKCFSDADCGPGRSCAPYGECASVLQADSCAVHPWRGATWGLANWVLWASALMGLAWWRRRWRHG